MNSTLLAWLSAWLLVGFTIFATCSSTIFGASAETAALSPTQTQPGTRKVVKTDADWKKTLTADQYAVLRKEGTERAFTSPLNDIHQDGTFYCAACHNLFLRRVLSLIRVQAGPAFTSLFPKAPSMRKLTKHLAWCGPKLSAMCAEAILVTCSTMALNQQGYGTA